MKYSLLVCMLLFLCSCSSNMMTKENFDDISLGTSIKEVEEQAGKPYAVHDKPGGKAEYEYIERIDMGNHLLFENHYFLMVSEGQVVSKRVTTETPPDYNMIYQQDPNHYTYP